MLLLFHPRQQQNILERFYRCHLVQLPQGGSPCTYRTIMFQQLEPHVCNIETHRYTV